MEKKIIPNEIDTSLLYKIYEKIRYVYPLDKTHYDFDQDFFVEKSSNCFEIWGFNQVCKNCISMRALKENRVTMKFECIDKRVYMITGVPEINNNRVLELIRDVTDEYVIEGIEFMSDVMMREKLEALNKEIITDNLTQIFNRRFLDERLPYELIRAFANQMPISLVMIDIDHFKQINDKYGHVVGDQVLIELAKIIKSWIRADDDWSVRYGGEEFLVYLLNVDSELLLERFETLRKRVEDNVFCMGTLDIHLTISCGLLNEYISDEAQIVNMYDLIKKADKALYEAKSNGRNQCVLRSE
ncbi:MAG TPA: GGDEF domain-containing protein [Clostridiales bacterium UBA8960]|jgi:diguanylate cyclase (GGDEF)-like protein|nr:GGDEF domain-containing protein [Clostridiales bacterium UBA8960]